MMRSKSLASILILALLLFASPLHADQATDEADEYANDGGVSAALSRGGAANEIEAAEAAPAEAATNAEASVGYSPADPSASNPSLRINGYIDIGFARAGGDGTSFAPGDTLVPLDYGVDTFAPAVNSRGDVASTNSNGQFTNGFLPHSLGIGGHASAFINTVDLDVSYAPAIAPILGFLRLQALPRFSGAGDSSSIFVEQAFARFIPFATAELAINIGKSDSVFGIEYQENEANLRTGITPSLIARYTTGQMLGGKIFYRVQLPSIQSALSINAAATVNGSLVDTLSPADTSQTGRPIFVGRIGYELNLPACEFKLGASGERGPRNDQSDPSVEQWILGGDARLMTGPLELRGEFIHIEQEDGGFDKVNGLGSETVASGFIATGGYGQAALGFDTGIPAFRRISFYGRYERRHAQFEGFRAITVDRITFGARVDMWKQVAFKTEGLLNRELVGAPDVDNNVWTNSMVFSW